MTKQAMAFTALLMLSNFSEAALLVTDLVGKVEQEGKGVIKLLAEIEEGGKLNLADKARIAVVDLTSGKEFNLLGPGVYKIESSGPKAIKGSPAEVKELPASGLPNVRVAGGRIAQATLVLRGIKRSNIPAPLSPVKTAVLTTTPYLRWSQVEGATSYRISIADDTGIQVFESTTAEAELQLSPSANLTHGKRYMWRIEAYGANGRFAEAAAQFSVITEQNSRLLAQLRPVEDAPSSRRVIYALQLQEAGAIEDAKAVWRTLAKERPNDEIIKTMAE